MTRRPAVILALLALLFAPTSFFASPPNTTAPNHEKTVWNYDGGLLMMTDGSVPSGPCFRLTGRATAPDYFENLKREDSDSGTIIHRGHDIVTEFPAKLHLSFLMYDLPCGYEFKQAGTREYLTRAMVNTMRLSFYWKHGLQMKPATGVLPSHFETRRVMPYASERADQLPEKLQWEFEFDVPSAGIPVTDSLVVILLTQDGHIAARAAARM
jgi:hypothetical protein